MILRAAHNIKSHSMPKLRKTIPTLRTPQAVAERCIVLLAIVASGHNDRRTRLVPWLKREGLWTAVSPREAALLRKRKLSQHERALATWRIEAMLPLLWALTRLRKLPPMTQYLGGIAGVMPLPLEPVGDFVSGAVLRSESVLRREQERTYERHWAVRDAQIHKKPLPRNTDPEVVQERHEALNWLINDLGEPWDEISTDT